MLIQHVLKQVLLILLWDGTERVTTCQLQTLCIAECLDLRSLEDAVLFEGADGLRRIENASRVSATKLARPGGRANGWLASRAL